MVEVYKTQNGVVDESPQTNFVAGSIPRGRMIILSEVEQKTESDAEPRAETPAYFYLKDNIWNETLRFLEKYMPPPADVKNRVTLDMAREIAEYNKVKVPVWKLDGKILDTKMPKGYRLVNPFSVLELR
jgi:hypothetical protein